MSEKELKILKLENRLALLVSRGRVESECGVLRKIKRQLRSLTA